MEVTITLPDELVKRAQAAGLLNDERLAVILESELTRAKHTESFKQMVEAMRAIEPPLTEAEIEGELNARRAERSAILDKLGQQILMWVRTKSVTGVNAIIQHTLNSIRSTTNHHFKSFLESLESHQLGQLREFVPYIVDGTIHNMLYMFEESDWLRISAKTDDVEIDDIRTIADGLHGYIFIWVDELLPRLEDEARI